VTVHGNPRLVLRQQIIICLRGEEATEREFAFSCATHRALFQEDKMSETSGGSEVVGMPQQPDSDFRQSNSEEEREQKTHQQKVEDLDATDQHRVGVENAVECKKGDSDGGDKQTQVKEATKNEAP